MKGRDCREVSLSAKAHALAHLVLDETLHDICRGVSVVDLDQSQVFLNGKQRSHRSTEVLPRGNPLPAESRNTTPIASRRRLHRSASRENRLPSWRGWIRLVKPNPTDSFGIGLSKGLSSRGIYVSAIRPGSVAYTSGLLQVYDRILKVNETSTKGRTCREVVALIRRSSPVLDLFVCRRH
uniref:PDZ domain-containing protein n=1 Tax=Echinococcus canadensis TaxID=519352 RepID=A0A915EV68_9CEST